MHHKTYIQDVQTPSLYVCFATLFVCLGGVDCTFVCLANGCLAMQSSCMYVLRCIASWQDTVTLHGKTGGCLVCMSCHVSTFTDVGYPLGAPGVLRTLTNALAVKSPNGDNRSRSWDLVLCSPSQGDGCIHTRGLNPRALEKVGGGR